QQIEEAAADELARFVSEQRLGAAIGRQNEIGAVDQDDAVGGGVEDRVELDDFGVCALERRSCAGPADRCNRSGQQRERRLAVPRHLEQPALGIGLLAAPARDRERLLAALLERDRSRLDEQAVEPAGLGQRLDALITAPAQKRAV